LRRLTTLGAMLAALVLGLAGIRPPATTVPAALAGVMAADASDYVPTAANLPPGYREERSEPTGGDLGPVIAMKRTFVSADGATRVIVDVAMGGSIANAQSMLTQRVNQLVQYQGWTVTPDAGVGDVSFRATGLAGDGANSALSVFRVLSITAEVAVSNRSGQADIALLDNVARLVAGRMQDTPDEVASGPVFPSDPVRVPGRDPPGLPPNVASGATNPNQQTGAEVTGSSSGSPIRGDTLVLLTVTSVDRPWNWFSVVAPPIGMEYVTVEANIEVNGPTLVTVSSTDFWINTTDARSWSPVGGRAPALPTADIGMGAQTRGWLTFLIPTDQAALQLTWRLRTTQSLPNQGNSDQTMVVPLTPGAVAQASVGTSAPPNSSQVVPPSSAPSGSGGPAGSSGPAAPNNGSGSGGSGGGRNRGGGGLR
jgi:hypothetical protein